MPSSINVSDSTNDCNELRPKSCCFCGGLRIWKHGQYSRNGFHWNKSRNRPPEKIIQRYKCKAVDCIRTFSALSRHVLPYCRFFLSDFLSVYNLSLKGGSAYSIWKVCGMVEVGLSVIVRLLSLFRKVLALVQNLCREAGIAVTEDLVSMSHFLVNKYTWFGFTYRWYHALYPARLWENQNPHNL